MLPDVIDDSELRTFERNESIFYSFFVFFQKFGAVSVDMDDVIAAYSLP